LPLVSTTYCSCTAFISHFLPVYRVSTLLPSSALGLIITRCAIYWTTRAAGRLGREGTQGGPPSPRTDPDVRRNPWPAAQGERTAPGSSRTLATSPPHHVLLSPCVRWALRAASISFGFRSGSCNTRYEWLARPASLQHGLALQEAKFAWRTNARLHLLGRVKHGLFDYHSGGQVPICRL